jgi:hypothetical protein
MEDVVTTLLGTRIRPCLDAFSGMLGEVNLTGGNRDNGGC